LLVAGSALFCCLLLLSCNAQAFEAKGDLAVQGFLFLENGAWFHQENQSASVAGNVELYHEIQDNFQFTLEAFYRLDSEDEERSHGDLRLAEFLYFTDNWEISFGIGRVFWGATEFVHLVDIINQTDQVEALDGEEKLGQPMVHLTVVRDWGVVEAFVLPWFRERTFPGEKGRFRTPLVVDRDQTVYENDAGQHHTDLALRYSTTLADTDLGLYYFNGTARDPVLLLSHSPSSGPTLFPFYEQIGQTGLDLQMVAGEWLFKGEAFYRIGQSRSYAATTFGFEYSLIGIAETMMDLGLIGEYVYDDRNNGWLPTIYENDIMGGLRLTVNDMDDSNILLGVIRDLHYGSTIIAVEASRRIGDSIRINLDASFFIDIDIRDPAFSFARDDFIKLEMVWYW
jgi:hypothetical protein